MGLHKKEINWELVELYIKAGCSQTEIADSMHVDRDTLRARVKDKYGVEYSAFSAALHSEGDILLKAQQFQKAMKGYWPALLWLGKVRLGQKEPDAIGNIANNQTQIDQSHTIMQLQHENSELKALVNQSKTE